MSAPRNPVVVVPARMGSSRLPGKPLADIAGEPMIVHVWRRAQEADLGPVVVACGEEAIAEAVRGAGGLAVMTPADLPSGSDRVHAAVEAIDPDRTYDAVLNLQGDLPTVSPDALRAALAPLATDGVDIGTIAVEITNWADAADPNVVKAVVEMADGARIGRALYFTRAPAPSGDGPLYHHHGLYGWRREALAEFVALPSSSLERRERLEQLRALAHGLRIDVSVIEEAPQGVDTPADLERVRRLFGG